VMSDGKIPDDESGAGCNVCCVDLKSEEGWLGLKKYDYKFLCMPSMPWTKGGVSPPMWFGKDEKLPLLLSLFLGLQHCLAMIAGIATSGGYLITNDTCLDWQKDSQMCGRMPWMISCAWITSGLLTIVQVFRLHIRGTPFYLGTGLISVMGTSFTFLPIARTMVLEAIAEAQDSWPMCAVDPVSGDPIHTGDCCAAFGFGNKDCVGAGAIGYGRFLGTAMVASLFEIVISFMPPWLLRKLFPPVVTGSAVMLIGGGLISSGMKYVGGGVFCAENAESRAAAGVSATGFSETKGNRFLRDATNTFGTVGPQLCFNDNGEVALGFGAPEYVGLAFSVIFISLLIQAFGSPFFKSTFLFWGLAFGCCVAAAGKDVNGDGVKESYYREDFLENSDDITFLWAKTFYPFGFSPEYFLPIIIGFLISTAESIGDIEMTAVFSKVTDRNDVASRIQGGLLADGVNSFLATFFNSPPNTTFSQNNGLIALTRCASRSVGFSCAFWLIILGVFGKFGALFASIPICVIGGVVLMAWSSVFVSGMKLATLDFTRRNQFILTIALGIGLGVAMEGHIFDYPGPHSFYRKALAFDYGFWPKKLVCATPFNISGHVYDDFCPNYNGPCCAEWDTSRNMWRTVFITILKTPYGIGFVLAFLLNLLLPEDKVSPDDGKEFEFESATSQAKAYSSATSSATPASTA